MSAVIDDSAVSAVIDDSAVSAVSAVIDDSAVSAVIDDSAVSAVSAVSVINSKLRNRIKNIKRIKSIKRLRYFTNIKNLLCNIFKYKGKSKKQVCFHNKLYIRIQAKKH